MGIDTHALSRIQRWAGPLIAGRRRVSVLPERRIPGAIILAAGGLVAVALVLMVPTYLLIRALGAGQDTVDTLLSPRTWLTLGNTLLLAMSVVLASAVIAVPLAWITTWTDLPGKRVWSVAIALPLVIPSYVAAYLFASLLSPKGLIQQALEPLIGLQKMPPFYGFTGAFFVLTLVSYPFTYLIVRAALMRMDPSLLEAARSLGQTPRQVFWRVTVPYLRPSITAGSLLVALYVMRDFGAVSLLQFGTFTRIIYNRYQAFRLNEAAALALILVALTLVVLYLDFRSRGRAGYARVSVGSARARTVYELGRWKIPALLMAGSVVFLALVVPAAGLLYWVGRAVNQDWLVADLGSTQNSLSSFYSLIKPAINSIGASLAAAVLTVLLALPVATLAVRKSSRFSHALERLTYTSAALPGVVVALAYVFVGTNYARPLYQTLPMLLIAYVVLFLPQAIGTERNSLLQISPSLEEAGRSLGQRPGRVFRRVTIPLLKPGLMAAGALVFLTAMKELPATLILSPIGFATLAGNVWSNIGEAFFARAAIPTLMLILLSSVPLAILMLRDVKNQ